VYIFFFSHFSHTNQLERKRTSLRASDSLSLSLFLLDRLVSLLLVVVVVAVVVAIGSHTTQVKRLGETKLNIHTHRQIESSLSLSLSFSHSLSPSLSVLVSVSPTSLSHYFRQTTKATRSDRLSLTQEARCA